MIGISIGYTVMGSILGIVFSLLFIRNDIQWVSFATSAGSLGILFVGYKTLNNTLTPAEEQKGWLLAWYLLGFLISTIVFFYIFSRLLKTQSEKIKLRILDIILGRSSTLEEYYGYRKQEIEQDLNADDLIKKKQELDLAIQRNNEILQKINDSNNQCIFLDIKKATKYPVTDDFIRDIPQYIEKWSRFVCEASGLTKDFCNKTKDNGPLDKQKLDAYFFSLCAAINKLLFANNPQTVRSHVRILDEKDSVYRRVVSVEGIDIADKKKMTDIPLNEGMIFHAFQERSSLIMSYNPECHYGKPRSQWYDYLTIPLYEIEVNIDEQYRPFISMGIAIQAGYHHEEMLVFLHFMKIEKFIQSEVRSLGDPMDIYLAYNRNEGRG